MDLTPLHPRDDRWSVPGGPCDDVGTGLAAHYSIDASILVRSRRPKTAPAVHTTTGGHRQHAHRTRGRIGVGPRTGPRTGPRLGRGRPAAAAERRRWVAAGGSTREPRGEAATAA